MTLAEFPNLHTYQELLASRQAGVLLVALVVLTALIFLLDGRFVWQQYLPMIRKAILIGYYLSFALVVLRVIVHA